jgi:hypothetical protein
VPNRKHQPSQLIGDKKALRILFDTHWSPAGWKRTYSTNPTDLAYALARGYMFPPEGPEATTHDAVASRLQAAFSAVTAEQVGAAFLASLSRRQPVLRSALASYALARVFPSHTMSRDHSRRCSICGYHRPDNRNVLNFERYKWGGVRHLDPHYAAFDLEEFARLDVPSPVDEDLELFRRIVDAARQLPPTARAGQLEKAVSAFLPSNQNERRVLLEILGIVGILAGDAHPGFLDAFVPPAAQTRPPVGTIDWAYPISWWRGGTVSDRGLRQVFPTFE